jgi:uncharacterized protein (TIGR02453 family)
MIKAETFQFLRDIKVNNNREWFSINKLRHDEARQNVLDFIAEVIKGLAKADLAIPADLDPKDCVMRIYRDIRFSLDKTPYKTNFGAGISPFGKNFNGPGYYLHISPDECFVAAGCWLPEKEHLRLIRQEIDYNSSDFRQTLENLSLNNSKARLDTDRQLKTSPKGYPSDHPDIEFLKLKSFTVTIPLSSSDLLKPGALNKVVDSLSSLYPFILFLRNAVS